MYSIFCAIRIKAFSLLNSIIKKNRQTSIFCNYKIAQTKRTRKKLDNTSWKSHRICARLGCEQGSRMAMVNIYSVGIQQSPLDSTPYADFLNWLSEKNHMEK